MSADNLDSLILLITDGEREPFRQVVTEFESAVRAVLAAIGPDREFVEELSQETFITAYRKIGQYQLGTNFRAWICQIARNLGREEIRRRARESKGLHDYRAALQLAAAAANEQQPSHEESEILVQLRGCVEKLPPRQAELIQKTYIHHTSLQDLAGELGRSRNWLRVTLHRIRKSLSVCLEGAS